MVEDAKKKIEALYIEERQTLFKLMLNIAFQKRENDFPAYPTDFTQEMAKAATVEDVLMDAFSDEKTIYFAYLVEEMKKAGMPLKFDSILPNTQQSKEMDRCVSQRMLKDGLPYEKICDCMSYSPNAAAEEFAVRLQMGGCITMNSVCPIYSMPEIRHAQPLLALDPSIAKPEDLYNSFLKAVLDRKPEMSHQEADEKALKLMKRNRISKDVAEKALATSLVLGKPTKFTNESDTDYYQRLSERNRMRQEFVFHAWNKDETAEAVRHDESLYNDMQKSIRNMTATYRQTDMVNYWNRTIEIMDYTLRKYDALDLAKKTLQIWAVGINKAVRDLGMEKDAHAIETVKKVQELQKNISEKAADFKNIMDSLKSIEHFSQVILQYAGERNRSNPLLQQIDIQHAEPFEKVAEEPDVLNGQPKKETARRLYASAVRAVLKERFIHDPTETETAAAKHMLDQGILSCCVEAALAESTLHDFKNKSPEQKQEIIQGILTAAEERSSPQSR